MMITFFPIALPVVAGLLHFNVFYQSLFTFISQPLETDYDNEAIFEMGYNLEKSIFFAYVGDLICCYIFNVVPFSRCTKGSEIAMHHLPVLLTILPLGIPAWAKMIDVDPIFHGMFGTMKNIGKTFDQAMRTKMVLAFRSAQGFGFISSLNEFLMCLQRSEMNLLGIEAFHKIPEFKGRKFMTSRFVIGLELYFKLGIFWIFPLISFKHCFSLDSLWYEYHMKQNPDSSTINALLVVCSSPTILRVLVFRLFMIMLYPGMGLRTLRKIMRFHGIGHESNVSLQKRKGN